MTKLSGYLESGSDKEFKEQLAIFYGLELNEGLGDAVKRNIESKRDEIIAAMGMIAKLSMKSVKITKDKQMISDLVKEMKATELSLKRVLKHVNKVMDYMFDAT